MLPLFRNNRNLSGLADNFFGRSIFDEFFNEKEWGSAPEVNITETKDHFEIDFAAPGLDKSDFKIDLKENVLTVSSEKKSENTEQKDKKVIRREFSYSSFSRSFILPEGVDQAQIKASHSNGILKIELPKKDEFKDQVPRQIAIH